MSVFVNTTWADDTEQTVYAGACRVTAIEIQPHPQQVNTVYLQLWDATNPNPGTTAATMVIPVGSVATQGAGTHSKSSGSAEGGPRTRKVIFPGGGYRFGTGCTILCTTTSVGETAATTTSLPGRVRVYYVKG